MAKISNNPDECIEKLNDAELGLVVSNLSRQYEIDEKAAAKIVMGYCLRIEFVKESKYYYIDLDSAREDLAGR